MRLADGITWSIAAGNKHAFDLVSHFMEVMQLKDSRNAGYQLLVSVDHPQTNLNPDDKMRKRMDWFSETCNPVICELNFVDSYTGLALQYRLLSLILCWPSHTHGGILLHGALVENEKKGIILAGPGGIGKTTTCQRLSSPWNPLCDDVTLIVRDKQGAYWAHPWPTWSDLMTGPVEKTWDVQQAIPLQGIFFLNQAHQKTLTSFRNGQLVCLLLESMKQAWGGGILASFEKEKIHTFYRQCFNNICALSHTIPGYLLCLNLKEPFEQELEKAFH